MKLKRKYKIFAFLYAITFILSCLSIFGNNVIVKAETNEEAAVETSTPLSLLPTWDPAEPNGFLAQGMPTQLTVLGYDNTNGFSLLNIGDISHNLTYNALAYNPADNYLYAVVKDIKTPTKPAGIQIRDLIRIGSNGEVERIATIPGNPSANTASGANAGAIRTDTNEYYVWRDNLGGADPQYTNLFKVSLTDGTVTNVGALSPRTRAQDFTFSNGYFWGLQRHPQDANKARLVRVHPDTAAVTIIDLASLTLSGDGAQFGAAFTLGNGDVLFSNNDSGNMYRIIFDDLGGVAEVKKYSGPESANNDGAAMPGFGMYLIQPEVVATKTVVDASGNGTVEAGEELTYTFYITNRGPEVAENVVLRDAFDDSEFSDAVFGRITVDGVEVTGDIQTGLVLGDMAADQVISVEVKVTMGEAVDSGAGDGIVRNQGTVSGDNFEDLLTTGSIDPDDPSIPLDPDKPTEIPVTKIPVVAATKTVVDASGNGTVEAGEELTYTFYITNRGPGVAKNVVLRDAFDDSEFSDAVFGRITVDGVEVTGDIQTGLMLGDMAVDQVINVEVKVTMGEAVDSGTGDGIVRNQGTVSGDNFKDLLTTESIDPTDPSIPLDPDKPTEIPVIVPEKPVLPEEKEQIKTTKIPRTGNSASAMGLILAIAGGAAIAGSILFRKREM